MAVRHSTSRRGFRNTQENSMRNIALVLALLATTGPVAAQDYLGTHPDSVRDETLRRHQQDMVTDRPGERRSKAPPRTTPSRQVSQAERQAAFSRNKAERSEEHTSELQSLMRISYAVFCLNKKLHVTTTELATRRSTVNTKDRQTNIHTPPN